MKKRIIIILLVVVMFLSCSKKSEAPSLVLYQTDFSTNDGKWFNGTCCKFDSGQYTINVAMDNYIWFADIPGGPIASTGFSVKTSVSIVTADPSLPGYGGILYNYIDNDNYSVFFISNLGTYKIYQKISGNFTTLQPVTASSFIKSGNGSLNVIQVNQYDVKIDLMVNGSIVKTLGNPKFSNYHVALVGGSETGSNYSPVTASFDNLTLSKLD